MSEWLRRVRIRIAPVVGGLGKEFLFDAQLYPHGYQMEAVIERDDTNAPDEIECSLWGQDDDERSFIQGDKGLAVEVFAGHAGNDTWRFTGDIDEDSVEVIDVDPGWRVTFKAGELRRAYRWTRWDESLDEPNITAARLFRRAALRFGVELAPLPADLPAAVWPRGFTARGPIRDSVDRIARRVGARWQLQGDRLLVTKIGGGSTEPVILLRAGTADRKGTGLIGSPTVTREGISFTALLIPGLLPQRRVRIESEAFSGTVKIKTVKERITTHETDFSAECEAVSLDGASS